MKVDVNDNILSLIDKTPNLIMSGIAQRVKQRRLEKGWTQKMLAAKAGLSLPSYRRFESSGEISVRSLVMLAFALDMIDEFETLFSSKTYQSIDDIVKSEQTKQRKRGHKNE
ncbi:MAG: helix-turn-helix transcriptional regulator [Parabacteroides sp.]|jgi:transcriptional regulator with XRE-family HTH domain|uniref:Helix-turn-helix n=2 Tax=Bacteroidales TaxID=171549 RepID=A0A1T5DF12_9BACT|nr:MULTISPECIES: helix-turn-helix transcriptional regulator [Bacteroidales]MDD3508962.1 helix-turn-helix transcriptional regulator [Parabacteroides sp.]MDT3368291.1 helix-turn-helix transcriptional regulator [Bacteroidota bacterium]NYI48354.1 transcriptional regulator with XRE-family HTH domain [Macellibacteroides fermentans]SKB70292.1 Helix-turn-helix [Parabacteroides chartae]HML72588.1 helix-turn-helix transcriptional regulator [Macellibacteroides fermentans]